MIQVCAWCRSEIRKIENSLRPDNDISHGICGTCYDNIRFQEGVRLGEYLNGLRVPVYVVDGDGLVIGVNRKGCEVLGKDPQEIVRRLGGEVFECAYARLPEGCGRTEHCSGCSIRKTVMGTFETGEPRSKVSAVLNQGNADMPDQIPLTITTVLVQGVVLLRVDEMAS